MGNTNTGGFRYNDDRKTPFGTNGAAITQNVFGTVLKNIDDNQKKNTATQGKRYNYQSFNRGGTTGGGVKEALTYQVPAPKIATTNVRVSSLMF